MNASIPHSWALVLVKERRSAKSRLAGVLDLPERMALQDAMLADVLSTLAEVRGLEGVAVCSPDKSHALMAEHHGAVFIEQPHDVPDINGAAAYGSAALAGRGAAFIGVIPGDLPLLETRDVEAAFDAAMALRQPIVIPDRHGKGTNGLFFHAEYRLDFKFGPDSFHRHLAGTRQGAAAPMLLSSFARDIDTPADFEALASIGSHAGLRTRAFLRDVTSNRQRHELTRSMDRS